MMPQQRLRSFNWKGLYLPSLAKAHDGWRQRADELSDSLKVTILMGQYMLSKHRGQHYAKAQNLSRQLSAAYDDALSRFDLLLMPTLPQKATPIPAPGASVTEVCQRAFEMIPNTATAVRCYRASGDDPALRNERRPAGGLDADRASLG